MSTVGSLCSGYGGLEMGLAELFDVDLAWVSDIDKGANKILAHRHPDVPNLGDFTTATDVEPVDVLTAGFPCQPVSHAGKRAGTDDERWLFDDITRLVGLLDPRPRLLVFENVLGLLSANRGHAMARVVHGLAQIGYVGSWRTLRAADVGAPHHRARVFIVAVDVDGRKRGASWPHQNKARTADMSFRRGHGPVANASDIGHKRSGRTRHGRPRSADGDRATWGRYADAIVRWEQRLGRPAPTPTFINEKGARQLSPHFCEWMMGLPAGWVTDVPGLTRNEQLKALGNGVVPQQAAAAVGWLLDVETRERVSA